MKERFYAGILLEKDLDLVGYIAELKKNPQVIILKEPEEFLVHEMRYVNNFNRDREDTGITHIGYDYHYVIFLYRGLIFSVNASDYYPFVDVNYPGKYNFVVYKRVGLFAQKQITYAFAYDGLASIDKWLDAKKRKFIHRSRRKEVYDRPISYQITHSMCNDLERAVKSNGGYRERSVYESSPVVLPTDTWNDEHKVIEVISSALDSSGHRDSFLFDAVTHKFC